MTLRTQAPARPAAAASLALVRRRSSPARCATSRARRAAPQRILKDNYRSVLAAAAHEGGGRAHRQRGAVHRRRASRDAGSRRSTRNRARFEDELRVAGGQHHRARRARGDRAAARGVDGTTARALDALRAALRRERGSRALLRRARARASSRSRTAADAILALNQDAMVRKSDRAQRAGRRARTRCSSASRSPALVLGLCASASLTARAAAPARRCSARRRGGIGEGDLAARARVDGGDEIGALAARVQHHGRAARRSTGRARSASCSRPSRRRRRRSTACPIRCSSSRSTASCCTPTSAAETLLGVAPRPAPARSPTLDPAVRARRRAGARARRSPGKGAYAPKGFEEAVRRRHRRRRAAASCRARAPLYAEEGDVVGVDGRAAGRHAPAPLRGAAGTTSSRPSRTSSARRSPRCAWRSTCCVEQARRAAHREAGAICCTPRARTASGCRRSSTSCSTSRASRPAASSCARARSSRRRSSRERARGPARRPRAARRSQLRVGAAARHAAGRAPTPSGSSSCFANLLANAIRHSPAGGTVDGRAPMPQRRRAALRGQRHGPGHRRRSTSQAIFEKFFRVPGAPPGGAGLGLSIARGDRPRARRRDRRRERARRAAHASGSRLPAAARAPDAAAQPSYFLRLRHSVDASMPRMRAASSSVGGAASTRRMCSRSICSSVKSPPSRGAGAGVRRRCARAAPRGSSDARRPQDDRALHRVAQLAHVARPGVARAAPARPRATAPAAAGSPRARRRRGSRRASGRMSSGRSRSGGTSTSITFRRKSRSSRKRPGLDVGLEVAVGRRDDAHVGAARAGLADALELACPAGSAAAWPAAPARSRRSRRGSSVPPSAASTRPGLVAHRAGEGAARVAEQLAREQLLGQRRAVDGDERAGRRAGSARGARARARPCRCRSRRAAGPARRTRRPRASVVEHRAHRAATRSRGRPRAPRRRAAPRARRPARRAARALGDLLDDVADLRRRERLGQVVARAALDRLDRGVERSRRR